MEDQWVNGGENESQPYSLNGEKNSEAAFVLLDGHCPVQLCSGSRLCDAGQAAVREDDTCIHPREQLQLPVPWLLVPAASDFLLLLSSGRRQSTDQ